MKVVFGAVAVLLTMTLYVPYLRDSLLAKTKPHLFTWLVWTVTATLVFIAQLTNNGGAGAWNTGIESVLCGTVLVVSLYKGEHNIVPTDWLALAGAVVAGISWALTKNPLWSVVFATLTDLIAFVPTIYKSWSKPQEETAISWGMSAVAYTFASLALREYSWTTALNPIVFIFVQAAFVIMLVARRRSVTHAVELRPESAEVPR